MKKIRTFMAICAGLIIGGTICLALSTDAKEDMTYYEICSICGHADKHIDKDGVTVNNVYYRDKNDEPICEHCYCESKIPNNF